MHDMTTYFPKYLLREKFKVKKSFLCDRSGEQFHGFLFWNWFSNIAFFSGSNSKCIYRHHLCILKRFLPSRIFYIFDMSLLCHSPPKDFLVYYIVFTFVIYINKFLSSSSKKKFNKIVTFFVIICVVLI